MLSDGDIVGVWRLVSHFYLDEDGSIGEGPLGADADGLLIYHADGYMAASVMRTVQPSTRPAAYLGTDADYLGYSGRWRIRQHDGVVVHDVMIGSQPRVVNTEQLREARLAGGTLSLRRRLPGSSRYVVMDWTRA